MALVQEKSDELLLPYGHRRKSSVRPLKILHAKELWLAEESWSPQAFIHLVFAT